MESRLMMEGEVTVEVPPAQLFRLWRNPVNLPALLSHIAGVERLGERRWRLCVRGTEAPLVFEVDADEAIENGRVGWRSAPGSPVDAAMSVSFTPIDDGASTRVHVQISYAPARQVPSLDVERALGPRSVEGLADDLARLKRRIEAGETIGRDSVEEASVESFPASDPPSWNMKSE